MRTGVFQDPPRDCDMNVDERLEKYLGREPRLTEAAFVAQNATVIGDVSLGKDASVWYGCVLRGDIHSIVIGEGTNLQDGTIVHVADDAGAIVGPRCTVGHRAIVHACEIEEECLIGMGSCVMDHARIGARSIVGANALVPKGMEIPEGSLVYGSSAKVVRRLSSEEQQALEKWAWKYVQVARAHAARKL